MNALDALGSPVRRQMLELLAERPRTVQELTSGFDISRPAVSRHLRVLQDAGLVDHVARGTSHVYAIRPEGFEPVATYVGRFWDDALHRFRLVAENLEEP